MKETLYLTNMNHECAAVGENIDVLVLLIGLSEAEILLSSRREVMCSENFIY